LESSVKVAKYIFRKTLPVLFLSILCFLIGSGAGLKGRLRIYTTVALFFGSIGDYMVAEYGIFVGVIFFLFNHIFYMLTFYDQVKKLWIGMGAALLFIDSITGYLCLWNIIFVRPLMCIIPLMYTLVLTICVTLSGSLYFYGGKDSEPKQFENAVRFIGYLLFYASDTVLVINDLAFPIPWGEFIVLSTYFVAQYLILWSTCILSRHIGAQKTIKTN
uniref:lysoplasmalogenase n=1 Tax=Syphacia muris TaxID=451379 RepID=A0A0N5AKC2_9BILA